MKCFGKFFKPALKTFVTKKWGGVVESVREGGLSSFSGGPRVGSCFCAGRPADALRYEH